MNSAWFVRDTDLLLRLRPEDVNTLQQICPYHTYQAGDVLYRQGEQATHLHIILEGHVKLCMIGADMQQHVLATLGENDFVGESFLSANARYRAEAIVTSDRAVTCPITRDDYLQLAFRAPRVVLSFTEVLASHLASCHDRLGVTAYPLQARVVHALLEEAQRFGRDAGGAWVTLERSLYHDELAARVNATRVSVTEVISNLRQLGLIQGTRGQYQVDVKGLAALPQGQSRTAITRETALSKRRS